MALFNNPKPLDAIFALPKFSARECTRMSLPQMSSMAVPNLGGFAWQGQQGQDQAFWWTKVFKSEEFWSKLNLDIGQYAFNIAHEALAREGLLGDAKLQDDIFINAKMGVLAGLFEKASNSTQPNDCHPLIWNAMYFFSSGYAELEGRVEIPESSALLRECTVWAGYAFGKIPDITVEQVFREWR